MVVHIVITIIAFGVTFTIECDFTIWPISIVTDWSVKLSLEYDNQGKPWLPNLM